MAIIANHWTDAGDSLPDFTAIEHRRGVPPLYRPEIPDDVAKVIADWLWGGDAAAMELEGM